MIKLGILGSTRGTHLPTLANAIQQHRLAARIELVMSNKPDAMILTRARLLKLKTVCVPSADLSREVGDQLISNFLRQYDIELVILMGYMRILSATFIADWKNKILNVHPSLLPLHAGKMDMAVHRAVLEAGEQEAGCTVHYVTEEVDAGPVILQKKCPVLANDTPECLKARIQTLEGEALIEAITVILR